LSVVIPAYNEEAIVESTMRRAVLSLRRAVPAFELILIDDCSHDATGVIATRLAVEYPEIRVVRNERNLRQGGSLRRGFALARHDLVTHNAIDYPFDFEDLPPLLARFPDADIVVAERKQYPGITLPRRFVSWANRTLLRLMFGLPLRDYNFVQIYKRELVQRGDCFSTATSFITPELIIRAHHEGKKVVGMSVDYHRREIGVSTSANWKGIKAALKDIARLRWELRG
jgi:glycosyltransferase involved in cell wall biosynthesis